MVMFPYSHRFALAQMPVVYKYGEHRLTLYPLRIKSFLEIDLYTRELFEEGLRAEIDIMPPELQADFLEQTVKEIKEVTLHNQFGQKVLQTNINLAVYIVRQLTRFSSDWDEEKIKEVLFPNGATTEALELLADLQRAVWRKTPELPKLNIEEKKPRYAPTDEENEARVYHTLATKYQWTYEQVLDLTDYQVIWYAYYMFPEEREHYEEMDEMTRDNKNNNRAVNDVPYQPGTRHFNNPEEYLAWKNSNNN